MRNLQLNLEPSLKRGMRWSHGFPVNWRKEKRRKRKLALLNARIMRGKVVHPEDVVVMIGGFPCKGWVEAGNFEI